MLDMDSLVEYGYESGEEEEMLTVSRKEVSEAGTPRSEMALASSERIESMTTSGVQQIHATGCSSRSVSLPRPASSAPSPHESETGPTEVIYSVPCLYETTDFQIEVVTQSNYLMPEVPKTKPSADLLDNITKLHRLKAEGWTVKRAIGSSSEFQNPYPLEKIMKIFHIDPYCSNYPRDIYDPNRIVESENELYDALSRRQSEMFRAKQSASKPTVSHSKPDTSKSATAKKETAARRPLASKWDTRPIPDNSKID